MTRLKPNEKSFFVRQNLCHGTLTIMPLQKIYIQKKKVLTNDYGRRYYGKTIFAESFLTLLVTDSKINIELKNYYFSAKIQIENF